MLEAIDIYKIYNNADKALPVLKGVRLRIEKGEFIAITGPSGAGKSTLLHILGGLDSPSKGRVIFQGQDLYSISDAAISKIRNTKIGFVFQFYHLLSEFTLLENVLMPFLISREGQFKKKELRNLALKLLQDAGLNNRAGHFPSQLSGGERQRAAIVRGLLNNPSLLLCDEPTGNLDTETGEEIISLIKKINQQNQMTVVLVTHNLELSKVADKVYHLKDGVLVN